MTPVEKTLTMLRLSESYYYKQNRRDASGIPKTPDAWAAHQARCIRIIERFLR